jgi:hypothetical protein
VCAVHSPCARHLLNLIGCAPVDCCSDVVVFFWCFARNVHLLLSLYLSLLSAEIVLKSWIHSTKTSLWHQGGYISNGNFIHSWIQLLMLILISILLTVKKRWYSMRSLHSAGENGRTGLGVNVRRLDLYIRSIPQNSECPWESRVWS